MAEIFSRAGVALNEFPLPHCIVRGSSYRSSTRFRFRRSCPSYKAPQRSRRCVSTVRTQLLLSRLTEDKPNLSSSSEVSSMTGSPLMGGFDAGSFTEALPVRIRAVLDGVWVWGGGLLENMSSSSVLVYLSANMRLISGTGLEFWVDPRTQLLCDHEVAPLRYLE